MIAEGIQPRRRAHQNHVPHFSNLTSAAPGGSLKDHPGDQFVNVRGSQAFYDLNNHDESILGRFLFS